MKIKIIVCFLVFDLICALPTFGQLKDVQGWREAKWGMTEDEILKAFKGEAVRLDKIEEWDQLNLYASIGINNYDINGNKYGVYFAMDKTTKNLKMVQIYLLDTTSGIVRNRFRDLEQLLTEKYGAPSFKDASDKILNKIVVSWNIPSTIIELNYSNITARNEYLLLNYSMPKGKDKI